MSSSQHVPSHLIIKDANGSPHSIVDVDRLQAGATRLMYQYAAAAGDDAELDRIGTEWAANNPPDYFGYVCAGALSLLVRNVLEPTLQVLDRAAPQFDFRAKLVSARDNAEKTLGGDFE